TSMPTQAPAESRCATSTALRSGGRRCDRLWCERAPAVVGVGVVVFIPAASPLERAAPSARWRSSGYVGGRTRVFGPPGAPAVTFTPTLPDVRQEPLRDGLAAAPSAASWSRWHSRRHSRRRDSW